MSELTILSLLQIIECLFNTVSDKRIAIFGFAFKKNTGDTRETPAITVCKILLEEGAKLEIYDPKVESEQIFSDLTSPSVTENPEYVRKAVRVQSDPYSAVERAHAIVVCTEWDDFQVTLFFWTTFPTKFSPCRFADFRLSQNLRIYDEASIHIRR